MGRAVAMHMVAAHSSNATESVEKIPDVAYDAVCHLDSGADGGDAIQLSRDPQAIRLFL